MPSANRQGGARPPTRSNDIHTVGLDGERVRCGHLCRQRRRRRRTKFGLEPVEESMLLLDSAIRRLRRDPVAHAILGLEDCFTIA
uniref:Uncharacterized protein n=1 Tax=Oryza rufipogon TaxID=4529 RepID=A0A0E0QPK5_ORYRU